MRQTLLLALVAAGCVIVIAAAATVTASGEGTPSGVSRSTCPNEPWRDPQPGLCRRAAARDSRCIAVSEVCTMIYQPVCGCNEKTYPSDCVRQRSRVGKKHDGACR